VKIVSIDVNVIDIEGAINIIKNWVGERSSRYVCAANVHMCMEAYDSTDYQLVVNSADLILPDGMPLVWSQKLLGRCEATRVRGPDLMMALCGMAAKDGVKIGVYGGTDICLNRMQAELQKLFPDLDIGFSVSPPFREITAIENESYIESIRSKGIQILFVGLGCPKQEKWMFENRKKLECVMVGVGAACDFISGERKIAPVWMQSVGLEWLFRLVSEPKRLWKRYAKHNPRFLILLMYQLLGGRL
ncbi:MAG: WecB/TagA/CpsF family glycosyltransferase, partial [Syntrophales bacterium LBB04]|nr:WecB/TagA/CpsF family glycosyltransferase [Syntrophales bacterium LBB04]